MDAVLLEGLIVAPLTSSPIRADTSGGGRFNLGLLNPKHYGPLPLGVCVSALGLGTRQATGICDARAGLCLARAGLCLEPAIYSARTASRCRPWDSESVPGTANSIGPTDLIDSGHSGLSKACPRSKIAVLPMPRDCRTSARFGVYPQHSHALEATTRLGEWVRVSAANA